MGIDDSVDRFFFFGDFIVVKYFIGALIVFVASAAWLYAAMAQGTATEKWVATPATIGTSYADRNRRGRRNAVHTPVVYVYDGVEYQGAVDDFLLQGSGTVYVNPEDPTMVVGNPGPNLQHYGRPLIVTIASGLFLVVLGLIAFSPKED